MATEQSNSLSNEEEKHALFRCIYIDPITQRVETVGYKDSYLFYREKNMYESDKDIEIKIENYRKEVTGIIENVRTKMNDLKELVQKLDNKVVGQLLINLRYLTKHIAFKEEQECRIVKIYPLNHKEKIKTSDDYKQMYVEYLNIPKYIDKIYFGPKAIGMELFKDVLKHNNLNIICLKSINPLN